MSARSDRTRRRTIGDFVKGGAPIVGLTAYTAPIAQLLDPHVDFLLVGDSVGMVVYGFESTVWAESTGRRNTTGRNVAMAGRRRSDRALRDKLRSPGRPGMARREDRLRFWALIAAGLS